MKSLSVGLLFGGVVGHAALTCAFLGVDWIQAGTNLVEAVLCGVVFVTVLKELR